MARETGLPFTIDKSNLDTSVKLKPIKQLQELANRGVQDSCRNRLVRALRRPWAGNSWLRGPKARSEAKTASEAPL